MKFSARVIGMISLHYGGGNGSTDCLRVFLLIDEALFSFLFLFFRLVSNLTAMLCIGSYEVTADLNARYIVGSSRGGF